VMTIDYATIHLSLFTHDAPGITQKDFDLAQEIDTLLKK
jgi:pterin-4a-carbinolamine dehydratase